MINGNGRLMHNDDTVVFTKYLDPVPVPMDRLAMLKDAMDLLVELWPKPGHATVHLETHQWVKLRGVLLKVPDLMIADDESL